MKKNIIGSSTFFADGDDRDFSKKFKNKAAGRKVRRKQERAEKKKHRAPTLSKIEILARQQHIEPQTKTSSNNNNSKDANNKNKKRKLGQDHLEIDLNEHEGETLVTDIGRKAASSKSKSAKAAKENNKPALSKDVKDMDTRRLEKLAKSNPAFYAMLQEDGVVAGGGPGFEEGFDEDEQYIRHYEKKLGLKRKDSGKLASKKSFLDDGLGDLLEGIELGSRGKNAAATPRKAAVGSSTATTRAATKPASSVSDKKRKAQKFESEEEDDSEDDDEDEDDLDSSDEEDGFGSFDEELEGVDPDDMDDSELDDDEDGDEMMLGMGSDEEVMESFDEELEGVDSESDEDDDEDLEGFDDEDSELGSEDIDDGESKDGEENDQEDAGSKARATPVAQTGKYLPPHLRAAATAAAAAEAVGGASALAKAIPRQNTEELLRLRRQLQGLLNKLSESNIEAILMDIEALYRKYPRAGASELCTTNNCLLDSHFIDSASHLQLLF